MVVDDADIKVTQTRTTTHREENEMNGDGMARIEATTPAAFAEFLERARSCGAHIETFPGALVVIARRVSTSVESRLTDAASITDCKISVW